MKRDEEEGVRRMFMNLLSAIHFETSPSESQIGILAVVGLVVGGGCYFIRWFAQAPRTPDPWDAEVASRLEAEDAAPICPNCLSRHGELEDFCSDCGAPVGACTNLLPFPNLFSAGHLLRIGTGGTFRRSPLLVMGFLFVAIAQYAVFAPVYWFMLSKNITRLRASNQTGIPSPVDAHE